MFALAKVGRFGLLCRENHWDKFGAGVRPVAERLVGRKPAGAVSVFLTGFEFDLLGAGSGDFRFVHGRAFLGSWIWELKSKLMAMISVCKVTNAILERASRFENRGQINRLPHIKQGLNRKRVAFVQSARQLLNRLT